jgi:hypothetical protein
LGAPPTELPYEEIDKTLGDFMQPWALAAHEALEWNTDDTGQVCKLDGIFRQGHGTGAGNFRLVEAGDNKLYQVWSSVDEHGLVRIHLNSPRPRNVPLTWNGDSRGRFEGDDTFIVDTTGFNDKSWLSSDRWVHSEELRVVERYRLYGGGQYIQLRVFVDDRRALKAPYTYTRYYRKVAEPTEGGESICNENAPEDDLWAQRRDKLLDEHEAQFAAFMAKYAKEPLPTGTASTPPPAPVPPVSSSSDAAKLRALAGIFEAGGFSTALPAVSSRAACSATSRSRRLPRTGKDANLRIRSGQALHGDRAVPDDGARRCQVRGVRRRIASRSCSRTSRSATSARSISDEVEHPRSATRNISVTRLAASRAIRLSSIRSASTTHVAQRSGCAAQRGAASGRACAAGAGGKYLEYQVTADGHEGARQAYTYMRYYQRSTRS